jgi:DNA repair exonuclease SbcCD ATPase subunit
LDTAVRQADECKNVNQDQGESAATIKQNLHKCEVRIEAQRLTVELSTTRKMQIEAVSGASSPEQIDLEANQPWTFDALGKVGIKFEGMTVAVKSGLGEIDKLLADHAIAKGNRDELLRDTMCKDLDEVCQSRINRNVAESKVTDAKTKLETELAGRTISDWDDDEQTISNIPSTRPLATVDDALNEIHVKEQVLIEKRSEHEKFIKEMKDKWPDQQTLDDEIAGDRTNLKTDQDNLTNCPTFPDGFTTASAFAADIKMRERKVEENRIKVEEANVGIAALVQPGDDDLESLRNTAEEERAKHKKELETAEQYRRIIDAINHIRGNADPFAAIADRITQLFNRLTNGRYGALSTASGLPTALRRDDGAELPSTRLSQGTAALLAIAVRIALAEELLKEAPMFVLMDDPFVDLDATRRKLAAQVLQELGERTQVIVLTCHEEHANELGPLRVSFKPH